MKYLKVLVVFLLIGLLCGARAETLEIGVRTYENYRNINTKDGMTCAETLDWLESFSDSEVGHYYQCSNDLIELIDLIRWEKRENDYPGGEAAFTAASEKIMAAINEAQEYCAMFNYCRDRMEYGYERVMFLNECIVSGDYNTEEINDMYDDIQTLSEEMQGHIEYTTTTLMKEGVDMLKDALSKISNDNDYIKNLYELGLEIEHTIAQQKQDDEFFSDLQIISDKEVAFCIVNENNEEIKGETFRIRINDTIEETTDTGVLTVLKADLHPDSSGNMDITLDVSNPDGKWRTYRYCGMTVHGGEVIMVPLAVSNGDPYIIGASFDDFDMYYMDDHMYVTPENDIDHTVIIYADTCGVSATLSIWQDGEAPIATRELEAVTGEQKVSITGHWLDGSMLKGDKPIHFSFSTGSAGSNKQSEADDASNALIAKSDATPTATATATPTATPRPYTDTGYTPRFKADTPQVFAPLNITGNELFTKRQGGMGLTIPDSIPVVGGGTVQFPWNPPFQMIVDLNGTIRFGFNCTITDIDKASWKSEGLKKMEERVKRESDENASISQKMKQGFTGDLHNHQEERFLGSSTAKVDVFAYGIISAKRAQNGNLAGRGELCLGIILKYRYEATMRCQLGPVPAFIGFDFSASLQAVLKVGVNTEVSNTGFENTKLTGDSGLNVDFRVEVGVSVGVGLPRVAYVKLRGAGWFSISVTVLPEFKVKDMAAGFKVTAELKLFWFQKTWMLWNKEWPFVKDYQWLKQKEFIEKNNIDETLDDEVFTSKEFMESKENNNQAERLLVDLEQPEAGKNVVFRCGDDDYMIYVSEEKSRQRLMIVDLNDTRHQSKEIYFKGNIFNGTLSNQKIDTSSYKYIYDFAAGARNESGIQVVYITMLVGNTPMEMSEDMTYEDQLEALSKLDAMWVFSYFDLTNGLSNTDTAGIMLRFGTRPVGHGGIVDMSLAGDYCTPALMLVEPDETSELGYRYSVYALSIYEEMRRLYSRPAKPEDANGGLPVIRSTGNYFDYNPDDPLFEEHYVGDNYQLIKTPVVLMFIQNGTEEDGFMTEIVVGRNDNNLIASRVRGISTPGMVIHNDEENVNELLVSIRHTAEGDNSSENTLGILYFDRSTNPEKSDFGYLEKRINIRDTGVSIPADKINAMRMGNNYYVYWNQSSAGSYDANGDPVDIKFELYGCMVDAITHEASIPHLYGYVSREPLGLVLLPPSGSGVPCTKGYYTNKNAVCGFDLLMAAKPVLYSVVPEYSVYSEGADIGFNVRLGNDGTLEVKDIDMEIVFQRTDSENGSDEHLWEIHIDMDDEELNSVKDTETGAVSKGAHTVYRMHDTHDDMNGETLDTVLHAIFENGIVSEDPSTVTTAGLNPGAERSYRTRLIGIPSGMTGKFRCIARLKSAKVSNASGDTDYQITRSGEGYSVKECGETINGDVLLASKDVPFAVDFSGNTSNDTVEAIMDFNDTEINVNCIRNGDTDLAMIHISCNDGAGAEGISPVVIATVDGRETWRREFKTQLSNSHGYTITVPVSELSGGASSGTILLSVMGDSDSEEFNSYDNYAEICIPNKIVIIEQPKDATVTEGTTASFSVSAMSNVNGLSYQWYKVYPDGTMHMIEGANSSVLKVENCQLNWDGIMVFCRITDADGAVMDTRMALLTVIQLIPDTGVRRPMIAMVLVFTLSVGALACVLCMKRRRER